jgi:hypothetical protein
MDMAEGRSSCDRFFYMSSLSGDMLENIAGETQVVCKDWEGE